MNSGGPKYQVYNNLTCDYCQDGAKKVVYGMGCPPELTGDVLSVCKYCLLENHFDLFLKHVKRGHFENDEEFKNLLAVIPAFKKAKQDLDAEIKRVIDENKRRNNSAKNSSGVVPIAT